MPSLPAVSDPKPAAATIIHEDRSTPAETTAVGAPAGMRVIASESRSSVLLPAMRMTPDGKQVPIGNGGIGPNYWWTQTLLETTVYIDVPPGTVSKDVVWRVTSSTALVSLKPDRVLLDGPLGGSVRPSECLWSLEVRLLRGAALRLP